MSEPLSVLEECAELARWLNPDSKWTCPFCWDEMRRVHRDVHLRMEWILQERRLNGETP